MRHLTDWANDGQRADTLFIMLPGALQGPEDFVREGFIRAVRERGLPLDLIMAELSFEQVAEFSALPDMHSHLIEPAQTAGYRHIWLAGISIGGYIAMAYAQRYPGWLAGMLLLAPYPGNRMTTGEISAAGGIHRWTPDSLAPDDAERGNWHWLKIHAAELEVHLSYSADDRFANGHAMMAAALPPEQVTSIAGGHEWPVWQQLWQQFLDHRFVRPNS